MQVTVQFNAKLPVKITKRKNWVLASCPILDVHTQGATLEEAKKNLGEPKENILDAYRGFYQKTNFMLKTIKECCIMVRRCDLKSIRIIVIGKRFGKISSVTGIDPSEVKSIRDTKI